MMCKGLLALALALPALAADDPLSTPITLHATLPAIEAYQTIAQMSGVRLTFPWVLPPGSKKLVPGPVPGASLNITLMLDFNGVPSREALDTISNQIGLTWQVFPVPPINGSAPSNFLMVSPRPPLR